MVTGSGAGRALLVLLPHLHHVRPLLCRWDVRHGRVLPLGGRRALHLLFLDQRRHVSGGCDRDTPQQSQGRGRPPGSDVELGDSWGDLSEATQCMPSSRATGHHVPVPCLQVPTALPRTFWNPPPADGSLPGPEDTTPLQPLVTGAVPSPGPRPDPLSGAEQGRSQRILLSGPGPACWHSPGPAWGLS